jgi:hypothetical protein
LPACFLPRGAYGNNPAPYLTAELGHPEQLSQLGIYHQSFARMREEKVINGAAELFSFGTHPLDHLLLERV